MSELEDKVRDAVETAFGRTVEEFRENLNQQLLGECRDLMEAGRKEAETLAVSRSRLETAEALAAAAKRLRGERSVTGIATALVEVVSGFAGRCALLIHRDGRLVGSRLSVPLGGSIGGSMEESQQNGFGELDVPLADAAALAQVVASREPVVADGSAASFSASVAELLGLGPQDRVFLFPLVLRDKVPAVLIADAGPDGVAVERAAIELLVSMAAAWIEAVGTRKKVARRVGKAAV